MKVKAYAEPDSFLLKSPSDNLLTLTIRCFGSVMFVKTQKAVK